MNKHVVALVAALVLHFSGVARADGAMDFNQSQQLEAAKGLKITGALVTGLGVALEVATIALWTTNDYSCAGPTERSDCRTRSAPQADLTQIGAGIATAALAPALLAVGIPMLAVGAHREKKLRVRLSLAPGGVTGTF